MRGTFRCRRLCAGTSVRPDFEAPRRLGASGGKYFFPKMFFFKTIFYNNFFILNNFFSKKCLSKEHFFVLSNSFFNIFSNT